MYTEERILEKLDCPTKYARNDQRFSHAIVLCNVHQRNQRHYKTAKTTSGSAGTL